ncbi:MAG: glycosyltransferase family 4 protein [Acidobacteriaceae bacterium]|nr:glycosyltransferase family 4 protein [Acidobacteriaceae bacterium]
MSAGDVAFDIVEEHQSTPRMAYLLSRYPAISHTFFLHEVLGLRGHGLHIETASINAPDRPMAHLPELEAKEASATFYVKAGSKAALLSRLLLLSAAHPSVVFRGLGAVLRVRGLVWKTRLMWLAYLAEALLVGDWMRRQKLQHLHVHFGGAVASVGYLTSIAWQLPYSLTIHGPEELQDFRTYQMPEKLQQAAFILCISWFAKSQLMQRLPPSSWHKLHVARLGVPETMLAEQPIVARETNTPHVVCVGRLVPEKGQRLLLQAIVTLRAEGLAITATLVGGGPELATLQGFAQTHGLEHSVYFAGAQSHPETLALLKTADLFVLPSFAEGIPVALMEAMALEIPCISTTVAGISELIRNGQDGLLVAPADVDGLTAALRALATDEQLRARMGNSSRARVFGHYRLMSNHSKLADIFRQELAREAVDA